MAYMMVFAPSAGLAPARDDAGRCTCMPWNSLGLEGGLGCALGPLCLLVSCRVAGRRLPFWPCSLQRRPSWMGWPRLLCMPRNWLGLCLGANFGSAIGPLEPLASCRDAWWIAAASLCFFAGGLAVVGLAVLSVHASEFARLLAEYMPWRCSWPSFPARAEAWCAMAWTWPHPENATWWGNWPTVTAAEEALDVGEWSREALPNIAKREAHDPIARRFLDSWPPKCFQRSHATIGSNSRAGGCERHTVVSALRTACHF